MSIRDIYPINTYWNANVKLYKSASKSHHDLIFLISFTFALSQSFSLWPGNQSHCVIPDDSIPNMQLQDIEERRGGLIYVAITEDVELYLLPKYI